MAPLINPPSEPFAKNAKLALSEVNALIVDTDQHAAALTSQILKGFGLSGYVIVQSASEAMEHLSQRRTDLCIVEYNLDGMTGAELTRWIRRQAGPLSTVPVVIFTGHTRLSAVIEARDGGANSVVKKPISAGALFDHIAWAATSRAFIETENYVGPDRRFKNIGPPDGRGRRATDLLGELGYSEGPNLSQNEIDYMVKPTKVVIT